jgi:hypothetical protein
MRAHTQRDLAFNTPHTQTHVRMNTRSCGRRVKYHTRPCTLRHIRTSAHACARANTYLPSSLCPSSFPPMSILQVTSSCLGEIGNGNREMNQKYKKFFLLPAGPTCLPKTRELPKCVRRKPAFRSEKHLFVQSHVSPTSEVKKTYSQFCFSPPSGGGKFA